MEFQHVSVLLQESIEGLNIKPNGIYVDGTAGGAGHSSQIARRLDPQQGGRLISIDKDPDAIQTATQRLSPYPAAQVILRIFRRFSTPLASTGWMEFYWTSAFLPASWIRHSGVFPIILIPAWICA